jgi:hypothetical protein
MLSDWTRHFCCNWCNFEHLSILSFHSNAGTQVNNTVTANDSAVLLPIADGSLAGCRKQICFVRLQLNLYFSSLVMAGIQGVTILRVEYYMELPQGSHDLQNDRGVAYRLTTFLGPDNLCTIFPLDFARDILATLVPMEITFMDNRGNIFVLDEFIEQTNSYIQIRTCEFINR